LNECVSCEILISFSSLISSLIIHKKYDESGVIESIDDIASNDRRYWLLTVVAGLFDPDDFPILEKKLTKLYRIAFQRQQLKHFGLVNGNSTTTTSNNVNETTQPERRRKRSTISADDVIKTKPFEINRFVYERQVLRMKRQKVPVKLQLPPHPGSYKTFDQKKNLTDTKDKNLLRNVKIRIHKLAHGDVESTDDENKIDLVLPATDKNNTTEIIYSVIVNGKAVLATTAAEDMRLVKLDEVARIMENDILLKAERKSASTNLQLT
jgi:hypothetical protein